MTDDFTPRPEHRFTFGLWTVGNPGRDPFGEAVRAPLDPVDTVHRLSDLGAYGVSFHDNDLVPAGSPLADRQDIVKRFRRALDATGMHVPMVTTNLFWRPIFKEGAFTANDPQIRRFAVKKACEATELGAEFGANVFVLWGGREGMEAEAAKDVRLALDRYKEAVDLICEHIRSPRARPSDCPRTQAQRAPGGHTPPHRRARPRLHRLAGAFRHGGTQPRVRP